MLSFFGDAAVDAPVEAPVDVLVVAMVPGNGVCTARTIGCNGVSGETSGGKTALGPRGVVGATG